MLTETEVRRYKRECHEAARFREHDMTNFRRQRTIAGGEVFHSRCRHCDMTMHITTRPRPNEYLAVGEALALTCTQAACYECSKHTSGECIDCQQGV